jgi:hypothetical protein
MSDVQHSLGLLRQGPDLGPDIHHAIDAAHRASSKINPVVVEGIWTFDAQVIVTGLVGRESEGPLESKVIRPQPASIHIFHVSPERKQSLRILDALSEIMDAGSIERELRARYELASPLLGGVAVFASESSRVNLATQLYQLLQNTKQ